MLGFLLTIVNALHTLIQSIQIAYEYIVKYIPIILSWLIMVIMSIKQNIPEALALVAALCVAVMFARLVFNMIRGSGA